MTQNEWLIIVGIMLIMPVIMIPLGVVMVKLGRGFNTFSRAALTREAQIFAARMMGGMMIRASVAMIVLMLAGGGIGFAFMDNEPILIAIMLTIIIVPIIIIVILAVLTEIAVRKRFDKDGKPYR